MFAFRCFCVGVFLKDVLFVDEFNFYCMIFFFIVTEKQIKSKQEAQMGK